MGEGYVGGQMNQTREGDPKPPSAVSLEGETKGDVTLAKESTGPRVRRGGGGDESRTYLQVEIDGVRHAALLDSGCDLTVVPSTLVAEKEMEKSTVTQLHGVGGVTIPIEGSVKMEVKLGDIDLDLPALVSSEVTEVMLGIDWMQKEDVQWQFGSGAVTIRNRQFLLTSRRNALACRRLVVTRGVRVRPPALGRHKTRWKTVPLTRHRLRFKASVAMDRTRWPRHPPLRLGRVGVPTNRVNEREQGDEGVTTRADAPDGPPPSVVVSARPPATDAVPVRKQPKRQAGRPKRYLLGFVTDGLSGPDVARS